MELYNKKFVYFDWDKELEGKKGFFSDNINSLKQYVKDNRTLWSGKICNNLTRNTDYPFRFIDESGNSHCFRFCYYDPYYEFRKAYIEGKQIQFKDSAGNWRDVEGEPIFTRDEYRIKPDDIIWKVVLSGDGGVLGIAKTTDKHIYFEGTAEECGEWIDKRKHLADLMKSWENGKTIQYCNNQYDEELWVTCVNDPLWEPGTVYRIKPEDTYVPFDNLNEFIGKWESMNPGCIVRPKCTMPMIWVKDKIGGCIYLINGYEPDDNRPVMIDNAWYSLEGLFKNYTFIDGSIIGKVKE